jgi:polygalacturonase
MYRSKLAALISAQPSFGILAAALLAAVIFVSPAVAAAVPVILPAAPTLPTVNTAPASTFSITTSYGAINGGAAAVVGSSSNQATAIQAYINYVSTLPGGGTVEVPAGTFKSGSLTMKSNVNLQLDNGSAVQCFTAGSTLLTTSGSGLHDMAITGSGKLDGLATTTSSNNLISLQNINRLLISGVTIQNAGHEHLVPEKDTNVTISGININDDYSIANSSLHTYLGQTDGIDYSGSNFRIENCTIADGDDNIVAKPANTACTNIVINNCTIISGHGISVGGGTAKGVSNVIVANCNFNPNLGNNPSKNLVTYALRMKAEDGSDPAATTPGDFGGGTANPLKNVKFINITMTNVQRAFAIESFYDGGDTFAPPPTDPTFSNFYTYGATGSPPTSIPPTAISTTTPLWQNIAFENVTATTTSNVSRVNGLNISTDLVNKPYANALDGLSFSNVSLTGTTGTNQFQLYYGANIDLSGLTLTNASQSLFGLTNLTTTGVKLLPGDFNRDGHVDASDISALTGALSDLATYQQTNNLSDAQMEVIFDLNNDFQINNSDIQAFLTLLQSGLGSTSAVPEPTTFALFAVGAGLICFRRRALFSRT